MTGREKFATQECFRRQRESGSANQKLKEAESEPDQRRLVSILREHPLECSGAPQPRLSVKHRQSKQSHTDGTATGLAAQ